MLIAITREVSAGINRCELTYQAREPIDVGLARLQHHTYEECLAALGYEVHRLAEEPLLPDSVFVEDLAIVLEELAVITRPGAASRRGEADSVAGALRPYRRLAYIQAPATLDGGDVLRLGKSLYVGLSRRSNEAAVDQLRSLVAGYGYTVSGVRVKGCLHLKSAVTQVARDTLLINRDWIDAEEFGAMRLIEVDPGEPSAANALMTGGGVIISSAFPATRRRLEAGRITVHPVDVAELAKAEGGVTCCSLLLS